MDSSVLDDTESENGINEKLPISLKNFKFIEEIKNHNYLKSTQ